MTTEYHKNYSETNTYYKQQNAVYKQQNAVSDRYKSYRIVDGKSRWVIVDENGKIVNKDPTQEDLSRTKKWDFKYNATNTCNECRKKVDKLIKEYIKKKWTGRYICPNCHSIFQNHGTLDKDKIFDIKSKYVKEKQKYHNRNNTCDKCGLIFVSRPLREYDGKEKWTGNWLCEKCYRNSDFRNSNLDPNSEHGKGYIFEQITCIVRCVKNLNIINNDFNSPIDHDRDLELGIIQTKGATYRTERNVWNIDLRNERDEFDNLKAFDNLICYCMDRDMRNVIRIYIFPWDELINRKSITITKNNKKVFSWYDPFEVDEKPYNDAYHNLKLEDCPVLRNDNGLTYVYELFA